MSISTSRLLLEESMVLVSGQNGVVFGGFKFHDSARGSRGQISVSNVELSASFASGPAY